MSETKPKLNLTDNNGNAFVIIGMANKAAKEAGWSKEKIDEYNEEVMKGDYDHLLRVTMQYFEVS